MSLILLSVIIKIAYQVYSSVTNDSSFEWKAIGYQVVDIIFYRSFLLHSCSLFVTFIIDGHKLKSDKNSDSLSINSMDLKISKVSRCLRTMSKILKILRSLFSNLRNGISTNISNLKLTKKINGLTAALKSIRAKLMQK